MPVKRNFKYEGEIESKGIENTKPKQVGLCFYIIIGQKLADKII